MPSINVKILEFVNGAVGYYHPLDTVFLIATSFITICIVGLSIAVYFGIYLPLRKEKKITIKTLRDPIFIGVSVLATYMAVTLVKVLVAFPRPFKTLTNLHVLVSLPSSYSFPSAHAALTMALATSVYIFRKNLGGLLFAFAFVVGLSRIYVGVHYPIDVGVGFLIGFFIPKLIAHFFIKKESLTLVIEPKKG